MLQTIAAQGSSESSLLRLTVFFVVSKVAMDNKVYTFNNLNLRGTTKQRVVEIIDTGIKIMQHKIQC